MLDTDQIDKLNIFDYALHKMATIKEIRSLYETYPRKLEVKSTKYLRRYDLQTLFNILRDCKYELDG